MDNLKVVKDDYERIELSNGARIHPAQARMVDENGNLKPVVGVLTGKNVTRIPLAPADEIRFPANPEDDAEFFRFLYVIGDTFATKEQLVDLFRKQRDS